MIIKVTCRLFTGIPESQRNVALISTSEAKNELWLTQIPSKEMEQKSSKVSQKQTSSKKSANFSDIIQIFPVLKMFQFISFDGL